MKGEKGGRPYYPYFILWMDQDSGLILDIFIAKKSELSAQFIEQSMGLLEKVKIFPTEIQVEKREVFQLLRPISSGLGINLRLVKKLTAMKEAKESIWEFFDNLDH